MFIVGNRNIETINYLKEGLSDGENDKILFFDKPFAVMKQGYEKRTGVILTDDEFLNILHGDDKMGLSEVKAHVKANPETDSIIKSDKYDHNTIELARKALLITRRK